MDLSLLRSVRTASLLIQKFGSEHYWDIALPGLAPEHLKSAIHALRKERQKAGDALSHPSLKLKHLLDNLSVALGGKSFEHWIHEVQPSLQGFFDRHGLTTAADLITWNHPPGIHPLTPRQVADRLFASGLPMPEKIFTGVDNAMFAADRYGAMELQSAVARLTGKEFICLWPVQEQIRFVLAQPEEPVMPTDLSEIDDGVDPTYGNMTLRDLLLLTLRWNLGCSFNLLGDNLVQPQRREPVHQLYNASAEKLSETEAMYRVFRDEMERTAVGWVDVLPFNENLVFLRGADGRYDWVVRDQRDEPFSGNKLHPIFAADEIPTALSAGIGIRAKLHFTKGVWLDQIEHNSEQHYYGNGGTLATYPGADKIVANYLQAMGKVVPKKAKGGARHLDFVAHALADKCLMVSELITIDEFWNFYESEWAELRDAKADRAARAWPPLLEMNGRDERDRPVCVNWFDAVAYCRYLERRTGLPVRLLSIEEWQAIAPPREVVEAIGPKAREAVVEAIDPKGKVLEPPTYLPHYYTRFKPDLCWVPNTEGLNFLSSLTFGEWLGDYRGSAPDHVFAPVACTASGIALGRGPLEREFFEGWYVGRNNHLKVGFRVCYVAHPDS